KNIKFLFLPDGEDPDSYIRQHGQKKFENLLEQATPLSLFLCNELSRKINLETDEGCTRLIKDAEPLLSQINANAPILAFMIKKRLAELARIDQNYPPGFLKFGQKKNIPGRPSHLTRPLSVTPCRRLIQILLHNPGYVKRLDRELLDMGNSKSEEMRLLIALADFLNEWDVIKNMFTKEAVVLHFDQTTYRAL